MRSTVLKLECVSKDTKTESDSVKPSTPTNQDTDAARAGFVARLPNFWYAVCASTALKSDPLARTILGIPMVLFRDSAGEIGALLDRCPHRNAPLSDGAIVNDALQCPYHGWRFRPDGQCVEVPGLCGEHTTRGREAVHYPVVEADGIIWVYGDPDTTPTNQPFPLSHAVDPAYTTVTTALTVDASLHAALENILDVPHTAFIHKGLFRTSKKRNRIEAHIVQQGNMLQTEYIGEPIPTGLMGRVLAPQGGTVTHFDRFILPSIAEVEYKMGDRNHIMASHLLTPITDSCTQILAVISYRLPVPGWMIRPVLGPMLRKVFQQDAVMLQRQSETVQRFGGERYVSTELDVMGPQIWQMLKQAEQGVTLSSDIKERRVHMDV